MKVPDNFILAVLFSEVGRLQKRAEKIPGSVTEVSHGWLEKKVPQVAEALAAWRPLITKAAHLASGSELSNTDLRRVDKDEGDSAKPLVSLFSKVPPLPEEPWFVPLRSLDERDIYPGQVPQAQSYSGLWERFNNEVDKLSSDLTVNAALVLLENYTACVPYLLPVGDNPQTDPFSDISFFDHLKLTAAIASCLYACEQDGIDWQDESETKYLLVGGDFSGVQDFIYRISSKGALKAVRGRSFFLELLTQHVVAELLEETALSQANVLYAGGAQFSLLLPNTRAGREAIGRVRKEINTYLIQVHGGKLHLALEDQDFNDNGFQGAEDGWAKVQGMLRGKISKKKSKKFSEFLDSDKSNDEAQCALCGASTTLVKEDELKRWELKKRLCRFCFLLVPKGPLDDPEAAKTKFSDSPQDCQWCKAKATARVLYKVGDEFITGCMHRFCLGKMQPAECAVCHRQTLLSPLPTPDVQTFIEKEAKGEQHDEPEQIWACPFCRNLYHVGEHLPDLRHVLRSRKEPSEQPRMLFNIGPWFYTFPLKVNDFEKGLLSDSSVRGWIVNERTSLRYAVRRPILPLPLGNYHPKIENKDRGWLGMAEEQKALDFSNLAGASIGSQLIGVLRMDVDNLGELFTRKLPKEAVIPARTSALSRLLSNFFTDFVNALCEGQGLPPEQNGPFFLYQEGRPGKPRQQRWVNVVYSGGDDLFVVGAWSEVIELAFDIHTAFSRYVCKHPEITLSGGMIVQHENFPLYQMTDLAKDAEKAAKENVDPKGRKKNSFAPFYVPGEKPFSWNEVEKLRDMAAVLVGNLREEQAPADNRLQLKAPRAFLTQLFQVVKVRPGEQKQLYLPRIHYVLARKDISQELRQRLVNIGIIEYLHPALIWLELLSREEGGA